MCWYSREFFEWYGRGCGWVLLHQFFFESLHHNAGSMADATPTSKANQANQKHRVTYFSQSQGGSQRLFSQITESPTTPVRTSLLDSPNTSQETVRCSLLNSPHQRETQDLLVDLQYNGQVQWAVCHFGLSIFTNLSAGVPPATIWTAVQRAVRNNQNKTKWNQGNWATPECTTPTSS